MVKFVQTPNLSLPVYILTSSSEQAEGFQGFNSIPEVYGLWFPDMNGRSFHMQNVGGELLGCGVSPLSKKQDNFYRVTSAEVWVPNGRCPYKGVSVLECSVAHRDYLQVGTILYLSDKLEPTQDPRLTQ